MGERCIVPQMYKLCMTNSMSREMLAQVGEFIG